MFFKSKFSFSPFSNPTDKIRTKICNRWGRLFIIIATHLEQSNYLANQQKALGFALPFTSLLAQCTKDKFCAKTILTEPKPLVLTFLHSISVQNSGDKTTCFDLSSSNFSAKIQVTRPHVLSFLHSISVQNSGDKTTCFDFSSSNFSAKIQVTRPHVLSFLHSISVQNSGDKTTCFDFSSSNFSAKLR
jgi:hypothetical protein